MHEIRIAEDLQKIILEVAGTGNLKKVTTVNLQFGELVQIVPDIFRFAFEEASRNTPVEGAALKIEVVPVKIRCLHCLKESEILKEGKYECVNCNSVDMEIIQGKELLIKSIEGE
jgi:hydrogenase nickel incorporation protein HypA/HybF